MDAISIIAEQRIREACERGDFDSLPGAGKPLELEDDSHIPEDLRMAYKLLKNAGYVPEEVLDRKEAQSIVDALEKCGDEQEKIRQMKKLEVVIARIKARHQCARSQRRQPVLWAGGQPDYREQKGLSLFRAAARNRFQRPVPQRRQGKSLSHSEGRFTA